MDFIWQTKQYEFLQKAIKNIYLEGVIFIKDIFDTHAHYDDKAFDADRISVIEKLKKQGVCNVINVGADLETSQNSVDFSTQYDFIYAAVGVHPYVANDLPSDYLVLLENLCQNTKTVAIGEIGLDYHNNACPKEIQKKVFREQLELAQKLKLPVIIHSRNAHEDTLNILKEYRPKGVVHCFSGSLELANEIIKLGMHIGLGGVVTFKNAKNAQAVAKNIPLTHLLLETDAPYMAPEPYRGTRCDSSLIKYIAQKIAELRNMNIDELLKVTRENAENLFFK